MHKGPRSQRIVESVREATLRELARVGYAAMTIGGVAEAADVNRTTIYRRWPNKQGLVAAAVEPLLQSAEIDPSTGSLLGDLWALIRRLRATLERPDARALTRVLMLNAPDLREVVQAAGDRTIGAFDRAFAYAQARGELGRDDDLAMMSHTLFFGLLYWLVRHERFPSDDECARMLRVTLAAAGVAVPPPAGS
ncbi:MAG: TetR/AcrR family transcriptional regulator [Nannocystaceae bacterium]